MNEPMNSRASGSPPLVIEVDNDIRSRCVNIYMHGVMSSGQRFRVEPLSVSSVEDVAVGAAFPPVVSLNYETAQKMMQSLWDAGIRPPDAAVQDKEVAALREHLTDLRRYLDHHLGLPIRS